MHSSTHTRTHTMEHTYTLSHTHARTTTCMHTYALTCTYTVVLFPDHFSPHRKIGLVNGLFHFRSLQLQKLWCNACRNVIWHRIKCGTTVAQDNAILRHFVAKMVFLGGSDHQETTILEKNTSFSDRETLDQSCWHSNGPFMVDKLSTHPDHSWNSWRPSCDLVSVLRSLVSCTLPRLLSFLGRHYSRVLRHFRKATWLDCSTFRWKERERNRPFTRPIFPA